MDSSKLLHIITITTEGTRGRRTARSGLGFTQGANQKLAGLDGRPLPAISPEAVFARQTLTAESVAERCQVAPDHRTLARRIWLALHARLVYRPPVAQVTQ